MTPEALRAVALSLSGAHEEPHFDRTSFRVGKKIFATMTQEGDEAMIKATAEGAQVLIGGSPELFFGYGGWTSRGGAVGVRLAAAPDALMTELLTAAWHSIAPRSRPSLGPPTLEESAPSGAANGESAGPTRAPRTPAKKPTRPTSKASAGPAAKTRATPAAGRVVDAMIAKAPSYARPILTHLRALVHEVAPDVTEEIKWGRPFFLLDGVIVCNMAAFARHCTFGFWAPEMRPVLEADGIFGSNGGGAFGKVTSLDDLPSKKTLARYLRTAAQLVRTGAATSPAARRSRGSARPSIPMPDDFKAALARSKKATRGYDGLSPSCRREYLAWVVSAKRAQTRSKRIAEAVVRIAAGETLDGNRRSATARAT
jgi:hypothetical protein